MARLLDSKKVEAVRKLINTSAPTGGMGQKADAAKGGSSAPEFMGEKMPVGGGALKEVTITKGKEKPIMYVSGAGPSGTNVPIYASMLKEFVSGNNTYKNLIDTTSPESMKKSLDNLKDVYENMDKKPGKRGSLISGLFDLARQIDKKYLSGSGYKTQLEKEAKIGVYKRNPEIDF